MDFVYEIPNNISSEKCKEIIERFEKEPGTRPGVVAGGYIPKIKQSLDINISDPLAIKNNWKDIDEYLCNQLRQGMLMYEDYLNNMYKSKGVYPILKMNFKNSFDTGYQIQKTVKGGYYEWHHDGYQQQGRVLTFLWYLNSLDPMGDGGCTEFECGRRVFPEEGKLILFPATWTYPHRGEPLNTDKPKYICTGWIHMKES